MSKIKILDESVSNIIAAGEVVENPASMIKEMVENSLDASATMIRVEVFNGGLDVKISDNGVGMDKEDTLLSIERHATSKISTKDDIFNLHTYGFRGEALASIASVSKLTIATRSENSQIGYKIGSYGGVVRKFEETSRNVGTDIEVRDLFYNTPARKKFLRKESTEYTKIRDIILKEALVNSDVAFALSFDGKESIKTSGKGIENAILELFGKNVLNGTDGAMAIRAAKGSRLISKAMMESEANKSTGSKFTSLFAFGGKKGKEDKSEDPRIDAMGYLLFGFGYNIISLNRDAGYNDFFKAAEKLEQIDRIKVFHQ
jgi:DNA mismatch repair protein MutL